MSITAKIIADSITEQGKRITTLQLRYPRFIHAEELTHRVISTSPEQIIVQSLPDSVMYDKNLSRNASSSRAIPVERVIQDVIDDPAMPVSFGKNQKGMQAAPGEHDAEVIIGWGSDDYQWGTPQEAWLAARDDMVARAREFARAGYHKQVVNRLLEPFSHINVVVTATEWANFFGLRNHPDADPTIHRLAEVMLDAMDESVPKKLYEGQWHLPYVTQEDRDAVRATMEDVVRRNPEDRAFYDKLIKVSVARCARVSYLTHDGRKSTLEEDLDLYHRLAVAQPLHASPAEHQASPDEWVSEGDEWANPRLHGNFKGWIQYRKTLANEVIEG